MQKVIAPCGSLESVQYASGNGKTFPYDNEEGGATGLGRSPLCYLRYLLLETGP
jgi:hypothetical protein